ncbi:unnamed protein product [Cuscuta epithymum]|uniref:Transposase-associated domain-containing protein n=1 Tax=Cuscuta epithymum TaxID=186058 RepID=A0AAV0GKB5_9ASTE|nr:unnamed protein product [Cuscuta epithymum]
MYERHEPFTKKVYDVFISGVKSFVEVASVQHEFMSEEEICCPCPKCKSRRFNDIETVKFHLYQYGFVADYHIWNCHGELLQFQAPQFVQWNRRFLVMEMKLKMSIYLQFLKVMMKCHEVKECYEIYLEDTCSPQTPQTPLQKYQV